MPAREGGATRPAVFLDRDGVLNADAGYVHRITDLVVLPGVPTALAELKRRGYLLVVVSNQSGVARGYYGEAEVRGFNAALAGAIVQGGGPAFDGVYYCPHLVDGSIAAYRRACDCRKPAPGMIRAAALDLGIDLSRSWMIGDKADDVECAVRAGVRGVQIAPAGAPHHPAAAAVRTSLAACLDAIPATATA